MTLTSSLIETCRSKLPAQVNDDAIAAARRCLLDSLAAAYAAYGESPMEMLRGETTEGSVKGEASVIGYGDRVRPSDAALVNGTMISLQLFDDNQEQMRNGLQGKTSLEYCVATTLLDGRPTLASFTDKAVRRAEITRLIGITEVRVPPELSEDVPEVRKAPFEQPVSVTIETSDGRVYSETVRHQKGSPWNPASDSDLRQKFVDCALPHLPRECVDAVLRCIGRDVKHRLPAVHCFLPSVIMAILVEEPS